jgi:hypothetical protein
MKVNPGGTIAPSDVVGRDDLIEKALVSIGQSKRGAHFRKTDRQN